MRRLLAFGIALLAGACLLARLMQAPGASAQSATTDWEKAAGGKMAFDVASVKQNVHAPNPSGDNPRANFPLDDGEAYTSDRGLLSVTNFPLAVYVSFAYKLNSTAMQSLESRLPRWAATERFDIQARAASSTTKDQMRLMMQSLLADRFKLGIHIETHQGPVLALVLVKAGEFGPQLHPYAEDPPCSATVASRAPSDPMPKFVVGEFPPSCSVFSLHPEGNGRGIWGSRNVSMQQIVDNLRFMSSGALDRPVVDRTGLVGNFDFALEVPFHPSGAASGQETNDSGPTFLEALSDQLGLKLKSSTGPVDAVVIDHIEELSPN